DLLSGEAKAIIAAAAVFETEHVVADQCPATARFPYLPGMQRRQQVLLPDLVHLFTHDLDDAQQGALPEEQVGVDSGGELANIAGADQEFVAGDLPLSPRFP